jgi:exodeoxyribonuclease VII large subunit
MSQMGFNFGEVAEDKAEEVPSAVAVKAKKFVPTKKTNKNLSSEVPVEGSPQQEEAKVLSVSDLNKEIKGMLEGRFPKFWIKAEISNFKAHTSGHFYFSLKDAKSQISAVMFKGVNSKLKFRPESGMEVMVRGRVTVYEPRGNYQIFCEKMEPVGAGALQIAFDQLKSKLLKEGLFDRTIKKQIPDLCTRIAIVTSPTGAAIRDMIHVLHRRFKGAEILVVPAMVQGPVAKTSIVQGIQAVNRIHQQNPFDVLIVGRGGGSVEDLWAFNEEIVARAIVASEVPVVSAVGHEVDYTISDFVADLRAPTPSAAAEVVVKNVVDLKDRLGFYKNQMRSVIVNKIVTKRQNLNQLKRDLVDPQRKLQDLVLRCDELLTSMEKVIQQKISNNKMQVHLAVERMGTPLDRLKLVWQRQQQLALRLSQLIQQSLRVRGERLKHNISMLDSLSPLKVLERGFSLVKLEDKIVRSYKDVKKGDLITINLHQGQLTSEVKEIKKS